VAKKIRAGSALFFMLRGIMTLQEAEEQILPQLEKMGYQLVDLSHFKRSGRTQLQLVIYKPQGVSMDDCVSVHRMLFPRLELAFEKDDIYLEVSSPGLGRKFKSDREYKVFKGRHVALLRHDENEWLKGIIKSADDQSVVIDLGDKDITVPYGDIQKGKLDFDKEIR